MQVPVKDIVDGSMWVIFVHLAFFAEKSGQLIAGFWAGLLAH